MEVQERPASDDVLAFQLIATTNDVNGNPRRHFALYAADGHLLGTIEEGYNGRSGIQPYLNYAADLGRIQVQPGELRRFLKRAPRFKVTA